MKRYQSNLTAPDLAPFFRAAAPMPTGTFDHEVPHEPEINASCGFMTHDEAAIVYHVGKAVGGRWVEIGTYCGWSAAHLHRGICEHGPGFSLTCVDPEFHPDAKLGVFDRCQRNLFDAGVVPTFFGGTSVDYFRDKKGAFIDGAVIDGNHDYPWPETDAVQVGPALEPGAGVVIFHDAVGDPIQHGIRRLHAWGFNVACYGTPQILTVCWRGNKFRPPAHTPDRDVDWTRHLRNCAVSFPLHKHRAPSL